MSVFTLWLSKLRNSKLIFSLACLIWTGSLILPHFQPDRSIPYLLLSALMFLILMHSINVVESTRVLYAKRFLFTLGVFLFLEIVLILLAIFGIEKPYLLLSRLGSYSMFQNGNLMLFGDLRHLTSVVNCSIDIEIGANVCDPWNRRFNQNPDIGELFRLLHLSNPIAVGVGSTLLFSFAVLLLLNDLKPNFRILYAIFLSPPLILALDRGNEVITISLILLSIIFATRKSWRYCSLLLLGMASVFKFWPIVILVTWTLMTNAFSRLEKALICLLAFTYLTSHLDDLVAITNETQVGDLNGGSFGIELLEFNSTFGLVSLILIFVGAFSLKQIMRSQESVLLGLLRHNPMLLALSISYLALFVTGSHFNYRLIILIPIALIISSNLNNIFVVNFILSMMITSRLNIVSVTSAILAIYLAYIVVIYVFREVLPAYFASIRS